MNTLGRIVLAFLSLAWIAAAGGLTALAWDDGNMLDVEIDSFMLRAWIDAGTGSKALFTLAMALVMFVGLVGFALAFVRRSPTRAGVLRLRQEEGGVVELPASALEALVVHALREMVVIHKAEASVALRGGTVATELDLTIGPGASISEVTSGANDCLTDVYRNMIGIKNVRRPLVRITIDETLPRSDWGTVEADESPAESPPPPAATAQEQPSEATDDV